MKKGAPCFAHFAKRGIPRLHTSWDLRKSKLIFRAASRAAFDFLFPLLSQGAVPVNPSALKESVTHHAVAEQKKDDCQKDYEQEVSASE
jgi:hypothetical protein